MSKNLKLILDISDHALGPDVKSKKLVSSLNFGEFQEELFYLLKEKNGFRAFSSCLTVFPYGGGIDEICIDEWNSENLWRNEFNFLPDGVIFFSENIFGDQFAIHSDFIHIFYSETGEFERIASTLDEWAKIVISDADYMTGRPLKENWENENGPLPNGSKLVPKIPFALGGAYEVSNLHVIDPVKAMRWYGEISSQIVGLADGEKVEIGVKS